MPTNGVFANYYNAKINVCGQCHNDAGASWTNTAAPPHPSRNTTCCWERWANWRRRVPHYQPGSHALLLTNQCVDCHMQTTPYVSQAVPANTGHTFTVDQLRFVSANVIPLNPEPLVQVLRREPCPIKFNS